MVIKKYGGILDAILNCGVTVACWKGCPPGSCCRGSKESNHIQQTFIADRVCFRKKNGGFAPWV